jgi:hypothetical protein
MLRGASQRCFGGPIHTSAYVSIRQHASACVSIRQHTSAYVSMRQHTSAYVSIRQHTSACVSMRQHASAYVSIRQHTSACVSIRQHTSAYVSIRQHTCFGGPMPGPWKPGWLALRSESGGRSRIGLRHSPCCCLKYACIRQHTSADVSVWGCGTRHSAASSTPAYVSIRQQT